MKLNWDNLHFQTREEILLNACINTKLAHYDWDEIDIWLQEIINKNLLLRSGGLVNLA